MPSRAPVRWPSEKRTLRLRQGSHLNTRRRVCDWTAPTHLCLPHARFLPCDRAKDVGTNTVRRTNGLGIKRIAPWEPIRVRPTLCSIPARGESWSSCGEPCESRGSSTVLREAPGEIPGAYSLTDVDKASATLRTIRRAYPAQPALDRPWVNVSPTIARNSFWSVARRFGNHQDLAGHGFLTNGNCNAVARHAIAAL
jgi:hypothetical protein